MNRTANYQFTILVPFYNEEDNMPRLERELSGFIKESSIKSCVLFINDGSKDNGGNLAKEICKRNKDFYYIEFAGNRGLSAAIKAGFDHTFSPYVGYIDADLQTTPQDFKLLFPYIKEYPLVMGIRANRKDSGFKRFQSKFANGFRRMMTKDTAKDTGCPLKILQTPYAKRIPMFTGMHRFFPALISLQTGGKMMQVPVRHFPREAGVSKYNLWNRLAGPFKDCFAFRWMKKRYIEYNIKDDNLEETTFTYKTDF